MPFLPALPFPPFVLPDPTSGCMQSRAWHEYCKKWGSRRGAAPVNMLNQKETAGRSIHALALNMDDLIFYSLHSSPFSFFLNFFFPPRSRSSSCHTLSPLFSIMMAALCRLPLRCLLASPFQTELLNLLLLAEPSLHLHRFRQPCLPFAGWAVCGCVPIWN